MSSTPCTRCGRILPPTVVRELSHGTRCPFCAAMLERSTPKSETPLYGTPAAKNPVFATTMLGRPRAFDPGSAAAPASAEAKAWLNALLKPSSSTASPLAAAASSAASPPAPASPPVLAPLPPATVTEPLAVAPAPVVEVASDKRPTVPMAAIIDPPDEAQAEPPAPPPPTIAARSVEPPPLPADALEEAAEEPAPEVKAEPPSPPPRPVAAAVPRAPMIDDSEALSLPVGNRRPRLVVAVGAVVLGGVLALILRGAEPQMESEPAPVAATAPAEPPATTPPAKAPVEPPKPAVEVALDPAATAKAATPVAEAAPAPAAAIDEAPRARRQDPPSDEAAVSAVPDEAATLRSQGLEYEKQGKVDEALAAYREYLSLAKRTRDRVAIARRMYDLTHPSDAPSP